MKFYKFAQNNSSGFFVYPGRCDVGSTTWIEASDHEQANRKAQRLGIYFDYREGDCYCCGERWRRADEYDGYTDEEFLGQGVELVKIDDDFKTDRASSFEPAHYVLHKVDGSKYLVVNGEEY